MKRAILALLIAALANNVVEAQQRLRLQGVAAPAGENPVSGSRLPAGDTSLPSGVLAMTGVDGGIPTRTTICQTLGTDGQASSFSQSVTAAQINTAITNCPAGEVVLLQTGTYTLSAGLVIDRNGVTLRGEGASSTILNISGTTSGCQTGFSGTLRICAGSVGNIGCTTLCGGPGPDHAANWTGCLTQGCTSVTLANHTGLYVGAVIFFDQNNDSSDGYPATGDFYVCEVDDGLCTGEGGNELARDNRAQGEVHEVVSCGTSTPGAACSSNTVVIEPGIIAPNYRAAQDPEAWWADQGDVIEDSGVEDLTINSTPAGTNSTAIMFVNTKNTWMKGVRTINTTGDTGAFIMGVQVVNGYRTSIQSNYLYGPVSCSSNCTTKYAFSVWGVTGLTRVENNIMHANIAPEAQSDPEAGSAYAYNYVNGATYANPGFQRHGPGDLYNLFEGNNMGAMFTDEIHGQHFMLTFLRNVFDRLTNNPGCANSCAGIAAEAHSRFFNVLGNVFGNASWTTYEDNLGSSSSVIFRLGDGDGNGPIPDDARVKVTMLRWGNYDSVNGGIRWVTAEVPSGLTNYANAVPGTQTVPVSYAYPAKPAWFGSVPWPAAGPDVTCSVNCISGMGNHANKIPARICFESLSNDAAYPSSSPRIKSFDRANCYGA